MVSEQDMAQPDSANPNPVESSNTNINQHPNPISVDPSQPNSPYSIGANDSSGSILITHVLDSNNYHSWERAIQRALTIKNKLGFVDGSISEPNDADSPLMEHWLRCNDIVITWLQNTMAPCMLKWHIIYGRNLNRGLKVEVNNQQRGWVMKFLMGLNDTYKGLKAQILLIKPFPSLNEVYSII
ncbi:uncharacterized protein LOC111408540 [Olea europaea var. sylvestris]|uniref:uncharacterized protein LOC111408540 n=1 Tax=Olea europaea var. sylvestris TaxID=158386 RepID=UPI000C1D4E1B|nr:uncharacterized protein LOC111408540 [Olea europaea var. sylvestris]